ncbi:MAG TPA: glycosyl hydrolase family 79 C-terminal domain-containing protein [Solirubrobacteraceae bacterium]|nr:glycosyl hydrolase family 79 C-terminal domain-containing protein [Solirubrobacteraceae bacterium]
MIKRALKALIVMAGLAIPVAVGSAAAAGATVASQASARAKAAGAGGGQPVRVTYWGNGQGVPSDFFGLSIEYNELPTYEQSGPLFDRVLHMLRPGAGHPLTLRLGGKSADHMLWEPDPKTAPSLKSLPGGVFELGQTWLNNLAQLVRTEHLRIILDLNLAVHSPTMAASFASAVRHALPAGALAGLEIGNEPDMYHFQPHLTRERVASTSASTPRHWWSNYSSGNYRRDYLNYARALRSRLGGVTLGGPDITRPNPPWLTELTHLGRLTPRFLAIHRYGASGCFAPTSSAYPTVSNLLSNANAEGLAASVAPWVRYAHARGLGLRVSEINSVSCGRDAGVANSFASALWSSDTLFSMLRDGVNALSWHIRPGTINAPFHLTRHGLKAEPELYSLALFAAMTEGKARLLRSSATNAGSDHLSVWTVKSGRTFRVLLINKSWHNLNVSLRGIRQVHKAQVRHLSAPGVHATGGVTFAGQRIGSQAEWDGKTKVKTVRLRNRHYHLQVAPYSMAMVTF